MTAEIKPLPSATVTLVRDSARGVEVLMMQRNLSSGFVPGMHLFPGGAVDPEDQSVAAYELCAGLNDADASKRLGVERDGLAYWVAAIRESFEEAGLLLASDASGDLIALEAPEVIERFKRHRRLQNRGEAVFNAMVRDEGLRVAANQLVYFSHWITPVGAPRRYDTRFFVAAAPARQEPLHDNEETISHEWVSPDEALERHGRGDFKMRFPTVRTLGELAAYPNVDALIAAMRAKREIQTVRPRIGKDGRRIIPGDPGYDELVKAEMQGKWKA